MTRKIGVFSSIVNIISVLGFAVSMLLGANFGSYLSSTFIAFSFAPMICAFCFYAKSATKLSGMTAVGFAIMYASIIVLVYYAQMTTVHSGGLSKQASTILDFQKFSLFFNYDMLGYALMALSTFFAGLTIEVNSKVDKWLKALLLIHGVFSIFVFVLPMLGLFSQNMQGGDFIGTAILIFGCIYFLPVGVLSYLHFSKYKA